jgi:4-amino-4-deoxy-L-arabinose transferase-like glycosyltransferase
MPFWALTIAAFHAALTDGRRRWWWAIGAAFGFAALAKYSAGVLALAGLALLVWESRARKHATPVNLLCAAAGFALVFGPHFAALAAHDFAPLHYLQQRGGDLAANASWSSRFFSFAGGQVVANLVPLLLLGAVWRSATQPGSDPQRKNRGLTPEQFDRRFLLVMGLGPFAITLAIGLAGVYLHPMWASSMFPLSGLLVVVALGGRADRLLRRRWLAAWAVFMLLIGGTYVAKNTAAWPAATGKYARAAYPGPELARLLDQTWRRHVPDRPLRTIVGTRWEAGVASFFSSYRTHVLIDADFSISPWIAADEIARCGAIVTWDPWNPAFDFVPLLRARFPAAQVLPNLEVDPDRPGTYYRKGVGVAVIAPAPGSPASACPPR